MFKKTPWFLAVAAASTLMLAACGTTETASNSNPAPPAPPPQVETTPTPPPSAPVGNEITTEQLQAQHSVYFDLDKSDLKPDADTTISMWATYLSGHSAAKVRLEGNCDERGTREYNVALGERRGNAVEQALEAKGVSPSQLSVISYGKERPVCTEHQESCWSQNRRADLVLQ